MGIKRQRKQYARKLTVALGVAVGLSGCFVTYFTNTIVEKKLHFVAHVIERHEGESGTCNCDRQRRSAIFAVYFRSLGSVFQHDRRRNNV